MLAGQLIAERFADFALGISPDCSQTLVIDDVDMSLFDLDGNVLRRGIPDGSFWAGDSGLIISTFDEGFHLRTADGELRDQVAFPQGSDSMVFKAIDSTGDTLAFAEGPTLAHSVRLHDRLTGEWTTLYDGPDLIGNSSMVEFTRDGQSLIVQLFDRRNGDGPNSDSAQFDDGLPKVRYRLAEIDRSSSDVVEVLEIVGPGEMFATLSPDERLIAFRGQINLRVLNRESGLVSEPRRVPNLSLGMDWSPDSTMLTTLDPTVILVSGTATPELSLPVDVTPNGRDLAVGYGFLGCTG